MQQTKAPQWAEKMAQLVDLWVGRVARHWLAIVNLAFLVYVILPLLAPVFMFLGWAQVGKAIYFAYRPFCHQLAERSFFLFGQKATYTLKDLQSIGLPTGFSLSSMWARRVFIGNATLGYKMAFCQRDLALYGSIALGGMVYALLRRHIRPLPWRIFLLMLFPLALDGGTQLVGWRQSTWLLRLVTGTIAGVAMVWALYPRLDHAMRSTEPSTFGQGGTT